MCVNHCGRVASLRGSQIFICVQRIVVGAKRVAQTVFPCRNFQALAQFHKCALENMDAKLMIALSSCRGEAAASAEGNWTEYLKAFSGKLFRPDVAPADAPPAPVAPSSGPPVINNPLFESAPAVRK